MKELTKKMIFCMNFSKVHSNILKKIDGSLSPHGISFTEYLIMYHLQSSAISSMRRVDLAEAIGLSASGVTRLIAPMEKIGLVVKETNERDARVSLVKITPRGAVIFKDASVSFEHEAGTVLGGLDAKDLAGGLKILKALGGNI